MKSVLIVFFGVTAISLGYPAVPGVSDIADLNKIKILEGGGALPVINDELDPESENIFETNFGDDEPIVSPNLNSINDVSSKNENDDGHPVRVERSIESDSDSDSSEDSSDEDCNSSGKAKSRKDGRRRNMEENDSTGSSVDSDSSDSSDSSESNENNVDRNPTDDGNAIAAIQLNNEVESITEAPKIDRRSQPEIRRKRMAWNVMRSSKESDEGMRSAPRMRWMWDDQKPDVESSNRNVPDLIDAVYEQGIEGQAYPRIPTLNFPREPCKSKFERRDRHGICRPSFMM